MTTAQPPEDMPVPGADLVALTAELIDIPSVSRDEAVLAGWVASRLAASPHLDVERIGDSVVARTALGRHRRLLLAGHLDTVPPGPVATGGGGTGLSAHRSAVVDGDLVRGLGAVDMKGGLAVLLDLAASVDDPAVDVTFVLYACEEVARSENALAALVAERPQVLAADAAVLAEPTGGWVEAGCQGTARLAIEVGGRRAHTARPWTGVNAVHRLGAVLGVLDRYEPRSVELDGCTYAEQMQAVGVAGGVAGNVVPDRAELTVNFRFAPDRDADAAVAEVHRRFGPVLEPAAGDGLRVLDIAAGALPGLGVPLLARLVEATGRPPRAKVGWTDVATLATAGIPAANFGPGDPLLAHTSDEVVSRAELDHAWAVLAGLLTSPGC